MSGQGCKDNFNTFEIRLKREKKIHRLVKMRLTQKCTIVIAMMFTLMKFIISIST